MEKVLSFGVKGIGKSSYSICCCGDSFYSETGSGDSATVHMQQEQHFDAEMKIYRLINIYK